MLVGETVAGLEAHPLPCLVQALALVLTTGNFNMMKRGPRFASCHSRTAIACSLCPSPRRATSTWAPKEPPPPLRT